MRASGAAPRYHRARAAEQKVERREAILDAAERMLQQTGAYAPIRMERIARRLGLAKGTLYLYFGTKETLFLAVMRRAFASFFDHAEARIGEGRSTQSAVAAAILAALDATPALPCLASVLHTALEHNVGDAEVAAFKHFLRERVTHLGARIDRALGWPPGSGAVLLLRFHVLLIGLHHVSTPSRVVSRVLADDALALFRIDFRRQLTEMLPLMMSRTITEEV